MKLKLFMPTTSIAGGLFMLKRTIKKCAPKYAFCYLIILEGGLYVVIRTLLAHAHFAANRAD